MMRVVVLPILALASCSLLSVHASKYDVELDDLSRSELYALINDLRADLGKCQGDEGTCDSEDCGYAIDSSLSGVDEEDVDYDEVYAGIWKGPDRSSYELEGLTAISLPNEDKRQKIAEDNAILQDALDKELTPEEDALKAEGYRRNQFNQYMSDQISLHRRSRDNRPPMCVHEKYAPVELMPSVTVIVVFFNEARSTLLRTAWSVINKTPPSLVKEIILVDDGSDFEHLGQALDDEVAGIPKTRIHRLPERVGLIQAKVRGVENATGDALVFMDSHCEVNDGWLEPLLDRIMKNPRAVALPVVDPIDAHTFVHKEAIVEMGVWSYSMHFYWLPPAHTRHDVEMKVTEPFSSPIMAGGIFAIGREFFIQSGTYDSGMDTWGGENFEMSFRLWMCGGVLESIPCSHIGHVFRAKSPYTFKNRDPLLTIAYNLNRAAEAWIDEPYKSLYYNISGNKKADISDVSDRLEIRKSLKCKSFDWYMKKISTFMYIPFPGNYHSAGYLRNHHTNKCIYHEGNPDDGRILVVMRPCTGTGSEGPEAMFWYHVKHPEWDGELRHEASYGSRCLHAHEIKKNARIELARCWDNELGDGRLTWKYDKEQKTISLGNYPTGCLTSNPDVPDMVIVSKCKKNNPRQQWSFDELPYSFG